MSEVDRREALLRALIDMFMGLDRSSSAGRATREEGFWTLMDEAGSYPGLINEARAAFAEVRYGRS